MSNIKNIVFDFGGVLLDWNPHYLYDAYFGDVDKAEWFLTNICTYPWNAQHDAGKPIAEGTAELIAKHPEWEKEIRMYYDGFETMMGGQIEGMEEYIKELKGRGFRIYGISNWSSETFALICNKYPILDLIERKVISGEEKVMKPDARIFEIAMQRFESVPEECVFIDDNPDNIKAAEDFGIHGIRFFSAKQLKSELEQLLK